MGDKCRQDTVTMAQKKRFAGRSPSQTLGRESDENGFKAQGPCSNKVFRCGNSV